MNIKRAKQEIKDAVQAYLMKDEYGEYQIPAIHQRPILLMGPPGIGKTQIMEQISRECEIGLVAYTITHHTRQSAIGLPFIQKKIYGGKEYSVTEYTMSEIIAAVYEKIEQSGMKDESCLSMRSTVFQRRWRRLCCSFYSARCLVIRVCRRDGSLWRQGIRRNIISRCGNLMW